VYWIGFRVGCQASLPEGHAGVRYRQAVGGRRQELGRAAGVRPASAHGALSGIAWRASPTGAGVGAVRVPRGLPPERVTGPVRAGQAGT
jgi:hypothetical protein